MPFSPSAIRRSGKLSCLFATLLTTLSLSTFALSAETGASAEPQAPTASDSAAAAVTKTGQDGATLEPDASAKQAAETEQQTRPAAGDAQDPQAAATDAKPLTHLKVMLDWYTNPGHGPLVLAQELGLFKQHGLDVELIAPADPSVPPQACRSGARRHRHQLSAPAAPAGGSRAAAGAHRHAGGHPAQRGGRARGQ
ncbi:ABC transporter substrate-binding protein [Cobetia marina]